ncbi:GNAT family N-acetyltransferase [Saccharopolyspora gloriosae]|uniref:GNAT family N-acetyltransferase n=1 Tax=Saccharopolyspora gloriosae TaxID=455344 RepID=UPI001FB7BAEC|nr:GNAT family N-acetyltransferase [Saccharopolyspora gloriosae]
MTAPAHPLTDLVRCWQHGWGVACGLAPADEADGALHVLSGKPGRHLESIVLDADGDPAALRALAAQVAGSPHPDWLTVPTTAPREVTAVLGEEGLRLAAEQEHFMTIDLRDHPDLPVVDPYSVSLDRDGPILDIRIADEHGRPAAHGIMVVHDGVAVAHNIATYRTHRRRGLGGAVMSSLVRAATGLGAETGLLTASKQGRHLYTALGWTHRAGVVSAGTREPRK